MKAEDVRRYLERDRSAVESQKRQYWAQLCRAEGGAATLAAAHALHAHLRFVRPDYPTERDRAEDLAHHVALKQMIDQGSRAIPVR